MTPSTNEESKDALRADPSSPEPENQSRDAEADASPAEGAKPANASTPGKRLAAKMDAKARRKANSRGRQAEIVEEKVLSQASRLGEWAARNRTALLAAAGAALVAAIIGAVWVQTSRGQLEASASKVDEALATLAEAGTDDQEGASWSSSQTALQEAFDQKDLPEGLRGWVAVALGATALRNGDPEAAQRAYEAALTLKGAEASSWVPLRAREGLMLLAERADDQEAFDRHAEALAASGNPSYEAVASYHRARREADPEDARKALQEWADRFLAADAETPPLSFLEAEVRERLTLLDPSYSDTAMPDFGAALGGAGVPGASGSVIPPGADIPPELLELLRKGGASAPPE